MTTPNNAIATETETDQEKQQEVAVKPVTEVQEEAAVSEEGGEGTKGTSSTSGGDRP